MVQAHKTPPPEQVAMLQWAAQMGAITAEALACRLGSTVASARTRLSLAVRDRRISSQRPLAGRPTLYTVTRAGLRAASVQGIDTCRVSASNATHLIACANVAAVLERRYPGQRVQGERELRRDERRHGAELASARLGSGVGRAPAAGGAPLLHRPDLVLWPSVAEAGLPVAVEVELTLKAPRRLAEICRAWARCRCVAGVLYLTTPDVEPALGRAIEKVSASERIVVVPLDSLALPEIAAGLPIVQKRPKWRVASFAGVNNQAME